jgi:uncharacterized membrane protein YfcA
MAAVGSLPPLIVGALVGAWVGVRSRDSIPERALRWGFSTLMVVVAFRILAGVVGLF